MTEKVASFRSPGWSTETPFAYSDALKATEVGDPVVGFVKLVHKARGFLPT